jgi:hypothetical protein
MLILAGFKYNKAETFALIVKLCDHFIFPLRKFNQHFKPDGTIIGYEPWFLGGGRIICPVMKSADDHGHILVILTGLLDCDAMTVMALQLRLKKHFVFLNGFL